MKKFISIILIIVSMLSFVSCDTYAQGYYMYNNGIVYEYSYDSYPVRYINGVAYYYCLTNGIWNWIILPRTYYHSVIHHRPMRYIHPHNGYRRPDVRFREPNWPERQRNGGFQHRNQPQHNNNGYRPHNGMNHQGGGSFNHSSSRGRR